MTTYVTRRLLQSLLVLFGVSFVVFFILHLTGDPALVLLPPDASAEDVQRFREVMGFNDPFVVQYGRFLSGRCAAISANRCVTASPRSPSSSSGCRPRSSWR